MSKIRNNPKKEIKALAALKDVDIDTSAIPEVKDWSDALQGRFCRQIHRQVTILLDNSVPSWPSVAETCISPASVASVAAVERAQRDNRQPIAKLSRPGAADTRIRPPFSAAGDCARMDNRQLITEVSMNNAIAAEEFVRRFQPMIANVVSRTAHHWGKISASLVDDLIQDVFLKIFDSLPRILKNIHRNHESAMLSIIRVIAMNVVNDNFKMRNAMKRGVEIIEPMKIPETSAYDASVDTIERHILFAEIDQLLKEKGVSTRDLEIFWLYYGEGCNAEEISQLPVSKLTAKGVESILTRLTKLVRAEFVRSKSKFKQSPSLEEFLDAAKQIPHLTRTGQRSRAQ